MPSWNELLEECNSQPDDVAKGRWIVEKQNATLSKIGQLRGSAQGQPRHVLLYGSAFLQKPSVPADRTMITHEDLNGFMSVIYGMDWSRGLTIVLHTPGGVTNAAESIVSYLRSKFSDVEVVVPALAMSAGTMLSLASDRIVMGRQSQLGPIDPQMGLGGGRTVSAMAVVEQFERAKREVLEDQAAAHVWAPIVQSLGPALLQEAQNALDYSESMVARWLAEGMLKNQPDAASAGLSVAHHFNDASTHKSHGRRIGRDEARLQGVVVEDLEQDQELQEAVLTSYHLMTITFEQSPSTKVLWSDAGRTWVKNWVSSPS